MTPQVPPLEPGTLLESFEIDGVLGAGGFGITYKAHDTRLERDVAIKEYLPVAIAGRGDDGTTVVVNNPDEEKEVQAYEHGLQRFLDEARTLAKFNAPSVVRVIYFFTANNSAYMVMQYEEGQDLAKYLRSKDWPVAEEEIRDLLVRLLSGLHEVHESGVLHRDIKPANIYIRQDQSPVLIDFGSARQHTSEEITQEMTAMVSSGYAPYEQYNRRGRQGPWSDLYSLGATFYYSMTGKHPVDCLERFIALHNGEDDPLVPLPELCAEHYSDELIQAISWMLHTAVEARPQSAQELLQAFANVATIGPKSNTVIIDENKPKTPTRPPQSWDDATLTQVEQDLAQHLGPMAKVMVKRMASATTSVEELYEKLAENIESGTERAKFLSKASTNEAATRAQTREYREWDQQTLSKVTEELTEYIGPMAGILVKKAARKAQNMETLYNALAGHIDSDSDRAKFLDGMTGA